MMQDVATAKSDIAAFADSLGMRLPQKPQTNENFDQLMQDQRAKQSQQQSGKKQPVEQTSSSKSASSNKTQHNAPAESVPTPKDPTTLANDQVEAKDVKAIVKELSKADPREKQPVERGKIQQLPTTDKINELALTDIQDLALPKVTNEELLLLDTEAKNAMAQLKLDLTEIMPDAEIEEGVSTDIVNDTAAEEWVALIENFQRLADIANKAEKPVSQEQPVTLDIDQVIPKNIEQSLVKQITEEQVLASINNPVNSNDQIVGETHLDEAQVLASKLIDTKVSDSTAAETFLKSKQIELPQNSITLLVQQALEELTASTEIGEVPNDKTQQQATELLLAHPQFLQGLNKELQKQIQDPEVAVENAEETVNTSSELLRSLLTISETATNEVLNNVAAKVPETPKLTKLEIEKPQPALNKVELAVPVIVADEIQIEAELSQITQALIAPVVDKNVSDNPKKSSDISLLLALPDKKLSKVLEHIAGRIMPSSPAADVVNTEQDISKLAQQIVVPKSADVAVATDNQAKEFIAALKSGIEEFKQQVAQGREPGIDLKALISDAIAKSNDVVANKASTNVQQISQSISQVLDLAQSISRAIEHHQEQAYSAVQRDVAQIQGEQSKSLQFNQFEAKFEKAVNITKPEGHQQLAEKVRWMVNTKNLVADIRLDPAELGSVHVKVSMSGESATVNFVVQSQHARDAMDNATPKLREMLAEKGIELGQSSVEQENKGQGSQGEDELSQDGGHNTELDADLELPDQVIAQQSIVNGALGGIDYFV